MGVTDWVTPWLLVEKATGEGLLPRVPAVRLSLGTTVTRYEQCLSAGTGALCCKPSVHSTQQNLVHAMSSRARNRARAPSVLLSPIPCKSWVHGQRHVLHGIWGSRGRVPPGPCPLASSRNVGLMWGSCAGGGQGSGAGCSTGTGCFCFNPGMAPGRSRCFAGLSE